MFLDFLKAHFFISKYSLSQNWFKIISNIIQNNLMKSESAGIRGLSLFSRPVACLANFNTFIFTLFVCFY